MKTIKEVASMGERVYVHLKDEETAMSFLHQAEYKEKNSNHKSTRRVIMFYDIFGGIFDFNGDGHTDFAEEAVGFAIMDDMMSEDESDNDSDTDSHDEW